MLWGFSDRNLLTLIDLFEQLHGLSREANMLDNSLFNPIT